MRKRTGPQVQPLSDNRILAALRGGDLRRVLPHLRYAHLARGEVLYEPWSRPRNFYFPTSAVVSFVYITEGGSAAEAGMVGNMGVVGASLFLGGKTTPYRALVQAAGGAYMTSAAAIVREFERGGALRRLLLRYTQARMTMTAQAAVCNRLHALDQRLCRWLLLICDRAGRGELRLTQEAMAQSLGVRREAVTKAAGRLQRAGAIRQSRGRVEVLDRGMLEGLSCECYRVVSSEYDRLIG